MKILQIHNFYQFKGGEDGVVEAERRMLEKAGHEVISAFSHNDKINNLFFTRKQFYKNLDSILMSHRIEVAHIHNVYHIIGNGIYKYLAQKGIPIIQTLHNFRFLCPAGLMLDNQHQICERCSSGSFYHCFTKKCYQQNYVKSFLMQWLVKGGRENITKYVTTFIALNPFFRNKFIEAGFSDSKFVVKPNFLFQTSISAPLPNEKKGYGLFLGRLSPEKGIETLIQAFQNISFPLKIAGTGSSDYVNVLKDEARAYPHIEFLGFVSGEEKHQLLIGASFLIVPSVWFENFPVTILEAYAHSKPVIGSAIGGLPFIVKDNITGFLVDPGSSEHLSSAVRAIIQNKTYEQLGQNAHQYFLENFTEQQNYAQLMTIYQSAIDSTQIA